MRTMGACCAVTVDEKESVAAARGEAERLAGALKALADETRIQIVQSLLHASRPLCECHPVALFDRSQPTVSYHLKVLREAGVVEAEKRGVWTYFRARPDAILQMVGALAGLT